MQQACSDSTSIKQRCQQSLELSINFPFLFNAKVNYCGQNVLPLDTVLSKTDLVHILSLMCLELILMTLYSPLYGQRAEMRLSFTTGLQSPNRNLKKKQFYRHDNISCFI
jgi:hypothetical protein